MGEGKKVLEGVQMTEASKDAPMQHQTHTVTHKRIPPPLLTNYITVPSPHAPLIPLPSLRACQASRQIKCCGDCLTLGSRPKDLETQLIHDIEFDQ